MNSHLRDGLKSHLNEAQLKRLAEACVGIAGAGGLGSNLAMMLARSGVQNLVLVDFDKVEPGNLNRQHYWPRHLNMPKVKALAETLQELNPAINLRTLNERLGPDNIEKTLAPSSLWAEALDDAAVKALLVEKALLAGKRVVAASGICGIGGEALRKKILGNLVIVGDFRTGVDCAPPMAPRVTQAAAMMADVLLEWILA